VAGVATMADLDELALAMPQTTKVLSDDGRPSYIVQELVVEAWLTRAQKRVAKAWLAEHGVADE
jgi:hypothetical protein